jgi:hypothetical protein
MFSKIRQRVVCLAHHQKLTIIKSCDFAHCVNPVVSFYSYFESSILSLLLLACVSPILLVIHLPQILLHQKPKSAQVALL